MNALPAPGSDRPARGRPILGVGRGRIIALAVTLGAVFPIALIHRHGDAAVARWSAAQRAAEGSVFWHWAAVLGSPLTWLAMAVVGFGVAAGMNWSNTARWMGVLAFGVVIAGLGDIAVAGETLGSATVGAVACTLTLWQSRGWPIWAGLGIVAAIGRMIASGASASSALTGVLLGVLGVLVVEFCWHAVAPQAPPRRGAPLDC